MVKNLLFDRRRAFRNRPRTDLLLDLITLKLLGKDNERVYPRIIREAAHATHGRGVTRGRICDPRGVPSLRERRGLRAASQAWHWTVRQAPRPLRVRRLRRREFGQLGVPQPRVFRIFKRHA